MSKNSLYKPRTIKIIPLVMIMFIVLTLSLSSVSAITKQVITNGKYPKIVLWNDAMTTQLANLSIVSNTERCSDNCEAVIKMDLFTSWTLPASPNGNFGFNFWDKARTYLRNNDVTDVSIKVSGSNTTVNNASGYWSQPNYVNIPWGNTITSGVKYIRITGKKAPDANIEWIPDFMGANIYEWATWDSIFYQSNNYTSYVGTVMPCFSTTSHGFTAFDVVNSTTVAEDPMPNSGYDKVAWSKLNGLDTTSGNAYNITFSTKINKHSTPSGNFRSFSIQFTSHESNCSKGFSLFFDVQNNLLKVGNGTNFSATNTAPAVSLGQITSNSIFDTWQNIMIIYNTTGNLSIYNQSGIMFSLKTVGVFTNLSELDIGGMMYDAGGSGSTYFANLNIQKSYVEPVSPETGIVTNLIAPPNNYVTNSTSIKFNVSSSPTGLNVTSSLFYFANGSTGQAYQFFYSNATTGCTQEKANVSSICGLNTGSYTNAGTVGWFNYKNLYDSNWNTSALTMNTAFGSAINITYTKPTGFMDLVWHVKTNMNETVIHFITPAQKSCLSAFATEVKLRMSSGYNGLFSCFNTTGETTLWTDDDGNEIYEEEAIWITSTSNVTVNVSTNYTFGEGVYHWNVLSCGTNSTYSNCSFANNNWTFTIDTTYPIFNASISPTGTLGFYKNGMNITLSVNTSDARLQSCWFNYNSTLNNTIACNQTYSLPFISGANKLFYYANDSVGNTVNNTLNWKYDLIENSRSLNTTAVEMTNQNYIINVTHSSELYNSISATLYYNGTQYTATKTTSGTDSIFKSAIYLPNVTGAGQIRNIYWRFALSNSTGTYYFNSSVSIQNVTKIMIDNCTTYTNNLVNFTMYDEDTKALLSGPDDNTTFEVMFKIGDSTLTNYREISFNKSGVNPIGICTQSAYSNTSGHRIDATIKYTATGKVIEYYNIQNYNLGGLTYPILFNLYALNNASSTDFIITYKDKNYIATSDVLIEIARQYIPDGTYTVVEIPKTDSFGKTIGHFVKNDVSYNIYVKKDGVTLATYENIKLYCSSTECTLNLNEKSSDKFSSDIRKHLGVNYENSYDETTRTYTLDFSTIAGDSKNLQLDIVKFDNYYNISVCSTSLNSSSGTLTCVIDSQYQNDTVIATVKVDGELLLTEWVKVAGKGIDLGNTRYLIAILLVLTLVGFATTSGKGVATVLIGIIGFLLAGSLYLIDFGGYLGIASVIVWIFVGGGIIIWKASKSGGDS